MVDTYIDDAQLMKYSQIQRNAVMHTYTMALTPGRCLLPQGQITVANQSPQSQ